MNRKERKYTYLILEGKFLHRIFAVDKIENPLYHSFPTVYSWNIDVSLNVELMMVVIVRL